MTRNEEGEESRRGMQTPLALSQDGGRRDANVDAICQAMAGLPPSSRRDVLVKLSRGLGAGALLSLLLAFEGTKPSRAITLYDNPDKIELGALLIKEDALPNTLAIVDLTGATYKDLKLANIVVTGNVDGVDISAETIMMKNVQSTGLLTGGTLSINADTTKFDIAAGSGIIVNNYTDVDAPVRTMVTWAAKTAIAVPDLATADKTYVSINAAGDVIQQTGELTASQRRDLIELGQIQHPGHAAIEGILGHSYVAYDTGMQFTDFAEALGSFNIDGNVFGANGANLFVDKTAGRTFALGSGYAQSRRSPNIHTDAAVTQVWNIYSYLSATPGVWTHTAKTQSVDPEYYDDGTGTLHAVTAGKFTIQQIFFDPEVAIGLIHYGQQEYDSIAAAQADVLKAVPIDPFTTLMTFRGWLIVQQGTTALNDVAKAKFIASGKLGITTVLSGTGVGESNTASNVGTAGIGVWKDKLGVDLRFKNIRAASSKLTVVENADTPAKNTVDIDVVPDDIFGIEAADYLPRPEGPTVAASTRIGQANFDGASYVIMRPVTFNRIIFRTTARTGSPTARLLIYQATDGKSGVANLVATCTAIAIGTGAAAYTVAPSQGSVTLKRGLIYVLWGRDSVADSFTARTYGTQNYDLITSNVETGTHPTMFTTAIAANTSPATFNPLTGATAAGAVDTALVVRLKTV